MPKQKACDIAEAEIQELLFESNGESINNDIGNLSDDSNYNISEEFCDSENIWNIVNIVKI